MIESRHALEIIDNPLIAAREKINEATCLLELLADAEENNPARYFPITLIIEKLKLADEDLSIPVAQSLIPF